MSNSYKRFRACTRKRAYDTIEDARQKGQIEYKCKYCNKWHRSGSLIQALRK